MTAPDFSASKGQLITASSLFSASDADGDNLLYFFYDNSAAATSGHFTVNGVVQAANTTFAVVGGTAGVATFTAGTASSDDLFVNAWDGSLYSGPKEFHVNIPANHAPTVTASDISTSRGDILTASQLFSANDAEATTCCTSSTTTARTRRVGTSRSTAWCRRPARPSRCGGAAGVANLHGGDSELRRSVRERLGWQPFSGPKEFHVNVPANHAPTVTASDISTPRGDILNASRCSRRATPTATTCCTSSTTTTRTPASGHFTVGGAVQAAGSTFAVSQAQLAQTTFTAGTSSSDDLFVNVWDGSLFSGPKEFHVDII